MKLNFIFLIFILFAISCSDSEKKEAEAPSNDTVDSVNIPEVLIEKTKLTYNNKTSLWTLNGERFSGFAVSYFQDNSLMQKFGILDGKKQNEAIDWYPDGHIKQSANYHKGKLHGEKKTWSLDSAHFLISHLNYTRGKVHGVQRKWYPTGEIFKILHLNMGKEEGMQQAFRKNGDLFANYEARAGRIFGLKKASLCYGLEDKNIQYAK